MPLAATVNHSHRTSSEIKETPRGQKEISSVWGRLCILSVYQKVGSSFRSLNPCQERISPENMSSSFQATLDNLFWCEGNGAKFIHREHLCGEGKEGEVQSKAELGHRCLFPQLPFCCPLVSYMGRKDCGASVIYYFDLFLSAHERGAWWERRLRAICILCECLCSRRFPELVDESSKINVFLWFQVN